MRTYRRDQWLESRELWDTGDFGEEWELIRAIAADNGFIYPPHGDAHDDRDALKPSQRAIIYRALVDNPTELRRIVTRSKSWSNVVDGIIGLEDRLRDDADLLEGDARFERDDRPTYPEAAQALKSVLDRLSSS